MEDSAASAGATGEQPPRPSPTQSRWQRTLRPIVFWTHLVTGILVGIVVLMMSATGVMLTYQKQMTTWADLRGLSGAPPTAVADRLPVDSILTLVRHATGSEPTGVLLRSAANAPVDVELPQGKRAIVNAYSGEILGSGSSAMRAFFRTTTNAHRWILLAGDQRARGRSITGVSNIAFLLLVLSGIWLWWPKVWNAAAARNILWFRTGLRSKARDFNWHNVIGFWSLIPLAIVVASGVVISYAWAGNLVYQFAGESPPSASREAPTSNVRSTPAASTVAAAAPGTSTAVPLVVVSLDAAMRAAERHASASFSGWNTIRLAIPKSTTASRVLTIDRGMGGEPHKRGTLTLASNGTQEKWQTFDDQTRGRRWRSVMRFAHTGEALGFWGQTIAGLVSLGAVVLVYTGMFLSWRRLRAWWQRRQRDSTRSRA